MLQHSNVHHMEVLFMFNSLIKPIVAVALVSTVAQAETSRMASVVEFAKNHSTALTATAGVATASALGYGLYRYATRQPKSTEIVAKMRLGAPKAEQAVQPGFIARNKGKIALGVTAVAAVGAGYYFFGDKIVEGAKALYAKLSSVKMSDIFTNKAAAQVTEKVVEKTAETVAVETVKVAAKVPTKGMFVDGNVRVTEQR